MMMIKKKKVSSRSTRGFDIRYSIFVIPYPLPITSNSGIRNPDARIFKFALRTAYESTTVRKANFAFSSTSKSFFFPFFLSFFHPASVRILESSERILTRGLSGACWLATVPRCYSFHRLESNRLDSNRIDRWVGKSISSYVLLYYHITSESLTCSGSSIEVFFFSFFLFSARMHTHTPVDEWMNVSNEWMNSSELDDLEIPRIEVR